jgi:hypothetical protein
MKNAVLYASAPDGASLPVIDVTHPAFRVDLTDAELATMTERYILESAQRNDVSPALHEALIQSRFGRALMDAGGSYLPGMITYLLKVGPDYLAVDVSPLDRRIAASFPALTTRLRLQDMAMLLADGLLPICVNEPQRPIRLINIAGGAASDSWNALICLRARDAGLLEGREIVIAVLDVAEDGPAFGMRAIEALRAPEAPLSGLNLAVAHLAYEWSGVGRLRGALEELDAAQAICAVSSEGGLFEYGTDGEIVSNLICIHTGTAADAFVVGSVTRDCEVVRASQGTNRVATRPRTLDAFRSLVAEAGWVIERAIERPFSYNVLVMKK